MTIEKLFAYVSKVKPHAFDDEVLLRWLSECEGMIQSEILLLSPDDVITYESVDATKTVTVTVTADADATSDRTKDRALLTVRDASGECVLDLTESELLCGEKKTFTLKDASTGSSKTVEAERKASDDAIAPGAVTLTVTVGGSSPVVTAVTPAAPSWEAAASASGLCPITLLVPAPYDRMYYAYLEAMIDYQEGEYNGYANTLERFNAEWSEYSRWVGDNIRPALGRAEFHGYYLSAYAIAVKHGYRGTEAEWIASIVHGKDGKDAVSPTVEIEEIQNGYELTIYDAAHPEGQTVTILDGETPSLPSWTVAHDDVAAQASEYARECECFAIRGKISFAPPNDSEVRLTLNCGGSGAASVSFIVTAGPHVVTFDAELLGTSALAYGVYLDGVGVTSGIGYSASASWARITGAALEALLATLTSVAGEAVIATK